MPRRLGALLLVLGLAAFGCNKKKSNESVGPSPEITGLAAVPASAQVVIAADVGKLSGSPIVARAVDQLLMRDPTLAANWQHVQESCKLDLPRQIKHVMLAIGPSAKDAATGTGPVLMIATGTIAETELSTCVRTLVGKGGGTLTAKPAGGRTIYQVKDGNRLMFFAFGRADTVVLGTSEAYVTEALGLGQKLSDNPEMKGWLKLVDQRAPVWAVGRVDDRVGQGLVAVSQGKIAKQPQAIVATLDPTDGAKVDLGVVMPDGDVAKSLESFAKNELGLVSMAAQMKSLGKVVNQVTISTESNVVRLRAALTMEQVNQLLSVLDEGGGPAQGSPAPQPK